jgi:phenylpropionate dioxygenase-like ring-hydroxylating dioxygenase large terminal subunit
VHLARNAWYVVLAAAEIPRGRAVAFRRLDQDLVFWRDAAGTVAAALDVCPHRRAKLSPGRVVGGQLECPFHGFRFDGTGACTAIPAHPDRPIPRAMRLTEVPVREAHGFVWVWTGPDPAPADPPPFFDFTGWSYAGSDFVEPVATHYTRAVENQLDYPHLPFVHANTIGRFAQGAMDIVTEVEGDRIRARREQDAVGLEVLAPNIWRLRTGPQWQFLAFVPVDATSMLYYVRNYQRLVTLPGPAHVLGWVNAFFNGVVLRQDTPPVESQPVEETRLRMGEVLIPADGPIIAYRKWREARREAWDPAARRREAAKGDG